MASHMPHGCAPSGEPGTQAGMMTCSGNSVSTTEKPTRCDSYRQTMTEVGDIHRSVEEAFNAGDTEALVDLYEEDAAMATPDGTFVNGRDGIREQWSGFVALGGNIQMTTRYAVVVGDTALLSNEWLLSGAGMELSSRTAEVARRQPDGTWKYVIDHPYAVVDLQPSSHHKGPPSR